MRAASAFLLILVRLLTITNIVSSPFSDIFDYSLDWHALRVTWSLNPFNWWAFHSLPRDLAHGRDGFVFKDNQCPLGDGTDGNAATAPSGDNEKPETEEKLSSPDQEDIDRQKRATASPRFLGRRYWYRQDPTLILLFDVKGKIAGIQTASLKNLFTPPNGLQGKFYIDDGMYWTQTVYFVDPNTICSKGRSEADLNLEGTGTGLWIQTGPNALAQGGVVKIPIGEKELIQAGEWGNGRCFWTMGQHYWCNTSLGMDCNNFVPFCLLYNSGRLTGFCFLKPVELSDSNRYDSPTISRKNFMTFLETVPDCAYQDPSFQKLSSIHVYFVQNPSFVSWC